MTEETTSKNEDLEAEKLALEIQKMRAEIAEATLTRVETLRKLKAEADQAEHLAALDRLGAEDALRRDRRKKREDANRVYHFSAGVHDLSVTSCRQTLWTWHAEDAASDTPDRPYTIVINSPGGSAFDGFALFDEIRRLSDEYGHKITTKVRGMAASMGGVLLQAGDIRLIGTESRLHLHEPSSMSIGKASDIKDTHDLLQSMFTQMAEIYARRSGGRTTANELVDWVRRQERWMTATEAVEMGFADGIG